MCNMTDPQKAAAAPDAAGGVAASGASVQSRLDLKKAIASVCLAVLAPVLLFSETSVKRVLDTWLDSCLVVIEKTQPKDKKGQVEVRAFVNGKAPAKLPLSFRSDELQIRQVGFTSLVAGHDQTPYTNLGLHPSTGQTCPGALCVGQRLGDGPEPVTNITLSDVNESFVYRFIVELGATGSPEKLQVYAIFDAGLKDGVCRVEEANVFNYLTRASKLTRFWLLVGVILLVTVVVTWLKRI
jgi:hypothetical protein